MINKIFILTLLLIIMIASTMISCTIDQEKLDQMYEEKYPDLIYELDCKYEITTNTDLKYDAGGRDYYAVNDYLATDEGLVLLGDIYKRQVIFDRTLHNNHAKYHWVKLNVDKIILENTAITISEFHNW